MKNTPTSYRVDWPFLALAMVVLCILFTGLLLRVSPSVPEMIGLSLEKSLIPLRYLDLIGLGIFLLFVYAGVKRRESLLLHRELSVHETTEQTINLELAELSSIFEVSSRVNSFRDVEEALQFIAHTARECLNADRSSVFLLSGESLVVRAVAGRDVGALKGARMKVGEGVVGWVALHRRPLLLNSRRDLEAFYPESHPERNIASALCVPLLLKGKTLGVLNVNRLTADGKEPFEGRHLKLLSIFAEYAASTIKNLRMYRQISRANSRLKRSFRDLKEVQEQLIHAEKMSAVGQLISEVSHELNNPLTTAIGYAQLLTQVNRDPQISEYLQTIHEEGLRCKRIIQNLLDFSRKNQGELSVVEVNPLVRKTVELRRYQLTVEGLDVIWDLEEGIPDCFVDPTLLQQVVLNLLNNAEQAILSDQEEGAIRFSTRYLADEQRIEISVADSGPGIPIELEERVFEPFYTTKPVGKGTGLGLSVCRGILDELGGEIRAGRAMEGGALFTVSIPAAAAEASDDSEERQEPVRVLRGKRILVVDDDPKVRALLAKALDLDEHEVETVGSAQEALEKLAGRPFDMVLSDILMPGMSGLELLEEARGRDEQLAGRFVFFSGGVLAENDLESLRQSGSVLLKKPFEFEQVRRTIHDTLRGADSPGTAG